MKRLLLTLFTVATLGISQSSATIHNVSVTSNVFTPSSLTINQGDTVRWTNNGGFHNVDGSLATYPNNPVGFTNGAASGASWTYDFTFNTPGTYDYECTPHAGVGMVGTITVNAVATPCADLFFSEYIEGSSNNKALEIYNPTGASISLTGYEVKTFNNGNTTATNTQALSGTIASGATYNIVNSNANATLLNQADLNSSVTFYNGNDAVVLFAPNGDTLDIIGEVGVNPTNGPNGNWAVGTGSTGEHTLVRDTAVQQGTTDWSVGATQWSVEPQNTFSFFGSHTSTCLAPAAQGTINFNQAALSVNENVGSVTVELTINPVSSTQDTVTLRALPGVGVTFPGDGGITPTPSLTTGEFDLVIPAGEDSTSFLITLVDDALVENNETLFVDIVGTSANLISGVNTSFQFVIQDNDASIPTYDINQINSVDASGVADSLNVECKLRGIVHSIDFDGNNGYSFYIYDNTGGINIWRSNDLGSFQPSIGDSIRVIGTLTQFNGLLELEPDSIVRLSSGNTLRAPNVVTALGESTEGDYIQFRGAYLVDPAQWPAAGSSANVDITNGTDTIVMRIDSDTDIDGTTAPNFNFDVRGAGGQFDFSSPFTEGYQLLPSGLDYIDTALSVAPAYPYYPIGAVTTNDVSFVPDSNNVQCSLHGIVHSTDFETGGGVNFYIYDSTGGINVFNFVDPNFYSNVQIGDSVHVFGEIGQFRGLTQIFADSIVLQAQNIAVQNPQVITELDETTEGEYVEFGGARLIDPAQWPAAGSSANVDVTNGQDTIVLRIDSDTDIDGSPAPVNVILNIRGAGGQFTFNTPPNDGYQLLPSALNFIDTVPASNLPVYTIASVTTNDANLVPDSINVECELRGLVHSTDFDGNNGVNFYIYDNTGGISVFSFDDPNYYSNVQIGDSVHVFGEIGQFRGLTQIEADSIVLFGRNITLKAPAVVSNLNETTEGEYIEVQGFSLVNAAQWPAAGSSATVQITDGTDTLNMRIDSDTDIDGSPAPTTAFDVVGAGGQFTFSNPANDGYQILPSSLASFNFAAPTNPTINFNQTSQTVLESVGSLTVELTINPVSATQDTVILQAIPGVGVLTPADGSILPTPDTVTGNFELIIPAGEDSTGFIINIVDDALVENNETLFVNMVGTSSNLLTGLNTSYQLVVQDNDGVPNIPTYNIADVTTNDANGVADSLGTECKLVGTVFTDDFRGGGGYQFYMYDNTGGINIFNFNDVGNYQVTRGDSIRVIGEIIQFRGLTELQVDSIQMLASGQALKNPQVVFDLDESTESEYVRLNGFTLVDPTQWPLAGSSTNVDITNGVDTLVIRIDSDTDIDGTTPPTGLFDVIGAGSQFDGSSPFTAGYQLFPRDSMDIIPVNQPLVYISEVMPSSSLSAPIDGDWFEIRNASNNPVNLRNYGWDDESRVRRNHLVTANLSVPAGGTAIFLEAATADVSAWETQWKQNGNNLIILNEGNQFTNGFSGLSSGGDEISLYDAGGRLISRVAYQGSDVNSGFSLEFDSSGTFLGAAVDGVNGAYVSADGDVGSPGDARPVSLSEFMQGDLVIYPNPANREFTIETGTNELKSLRILSIDGRLLMDRESTDRNMRVSVQDWQAGVYIIRLEIDGEQRSQRLVVH